VGDDEGDDEEWELILLLIILCIVTLIYCKKEIMKYKNPSIVHKEYRRQQGNDK